jgi:hypothetical protein
MPPLIEVIRHILLLVRNAYLGMMHRIVIGCQQPILEQDLKPTIVGVLIDLHKSGAMSE